MSGAEGDKAPGAFWLRAGVVLLPVVPAFWWAATHEGISRRESHDGRLALAVAGIVLIGLTAALARRSVGLGWPRRLFDERRAKSPGRALVGRLVVGVWLGAITIGALNYYQYDDKPFTTPGDYADATYYYLNSKYFDELGYHRLYQAMLVADDEKSKRFRKVRRYRDLVGYEDFFTRDWALAHKEEVKQHFSEERWAQFRHDVDWITSKNPNQGWGYFFADHGYNPPPSWTLVGGTLAELCPVEHIKWITMVDFVLIVIVFACIGWAFGGWALLVTLLWFLCTFSGRWPILGQSLLRFDWLSCLVVAACVLKKGRHALAGGLLTYAALNRIFPAVFGYPYVVWAVREAVERRRRGEPLLGPGPKRFLLGVAVSLAVFGLGAAVVVGPQSYVDSAHNLKMHGSPDSYSSHRVGLGDALVYQFEMSRDEIRQNGGMRGKTETLWNFQPWLKGFGVLSALGIAWYIWRRREAPWRLLWLGMFPLFIMTTPQINYYNLRLLPLLIHMELLGDEKKRWHLWPLLWLFFIEVTTQWTMVERAPRYAVTSVTSVGLCVYLAFMAVALFREARAGDDESEDPAKGGGSASLEEKTA